MGYFEVIKNGKGDYKFVLYSNNKEVIMDSKSYDSRIKCYDGIEDLKKNAEGDVIDKTLNTNVNKI